MTLKPYVRYAAHHVWLDTYVLDRTIWDHEFIFIERGSLKFEIEGKIYIASENDLVILRPNIDHKITWNGENCSQPHVHFDFEELPDSPFITVSKKRKKEMSEEELKLFRKDFFLENQIEVPYIFHLTNHTVFKNLLFKIIDEFEHQSPYKDLALQGLMTNLIVLVLRELEAISESDDLSKRLNEIVIFMNENVDKNLLLSDIAEAFKLSSWTLNKMFNKYYKTSPIKYYNNLKFNRALELLKYSFIPISEISFKMGFNDPQTFSRWFYNIDGKYPSYYRKN